MRSLGWRLPRHWFLFIILPLAAFFSANALLSYAGGAAFELAVPFQVDGHLEATGRLRTLATFLLYAAFAIGSILYAARVILDVETSDRIRLFGAAVGTMIAGIAGMAMFELNRGDAYFEINFACASLDRIQPADAGAGAAAALPQARQPEAKAVSPGEPQAAEPATPPGDEGGGGSGKAEVQKAPDKPQRSAIDEISCPSSIESPFFVPAGRIDGNNGFRHLRMTYAIAAILLCLAIPALVWGAIGCLALPDTASPRERYAAWARQTDRLNRLLYITAAFLIAGLFYSSARWSWPGYSLHPDDIVPYREHVRSLVLYLGVLNSVLIASYYLPVAARLTELRPPAPAAIWPAAGKDGSAGEKPNPFAAYSKALTILSPAILGLLGELLKFSP